MALRITFGEIIESTLSEARLSTNSSRGTDMREHVKQAIRRHYNMLLEEFDWTHLELKRDDSQGEKLLDAGQRYYDFPVAVNPMKISGAWLKWGSSWHSLDYGITPADYNGLDPEDDQRSDPALKWAFHGATQFEVWPLPATDDIPLRFTGQKLGEALTADDSRADIDDMLIYLRAAAEILTENGQKDAASAKGAAAGRRLAQVRAGYADRTRVYVSMGTATPRYRPRVITHIG